MAKEIWRCAIAAVLLALGCGQDPAPSGEKFIPPVSPELITNWAATGPEFDPTPEFGAQFGQTVATNGNWIAATRLGVGGDYARTEAWLHTSSGWVHKFTWNTPPDRHPVVTLTTDWLYIGEPCLSSANGCAGTVFAFILSGDAWFADDQLNGLTPAWDFGSAIAANQLGAAAVLAISGGGVVQTYDAQTLAPAATLVEPATPYTGTGFGSALAVTSAGVAVGAPNGVRPGFIQKNRPRSPGFVYVFGPGKVVTKLTGVGTEVAATGPGFGASVSASPDGSSLAVGAGTELGRQLTAYVFRLGTNGAWTTSNVIAPPSGASGGSIAVAIDGSLAIAIDAPGSTTLGTLRFFEVSPLTGATLDNTFPLDVSVATVSLQAGRAIVGEPAVGNVGEVMTFAVVAPARAP
jgi:hypothetical protein